MASLSTTTPFPPPTTTNRRPALPHAHLLTRPEPDPEPLTSSSSSIGKPRNTTTAVTDERTRRIAKEVEKQKAKEARERKEVVNRKIASQKAISVILRREATKAIIEKRKKKGPTNSKKLLPRTVLEALHERVTALRWESALKVFGLLREQLWYKPNSGVYIKLIVMLGKCKQPEKALALFQAMVDEGCVLDCESYTALLSAYSRSGLLDRAFSLLEEMKSTPGCQPDVQTYSILIKSCLQVFAFDKVHSILSDMAVHGIKPNTVTYNTLIDAYGKAKKVFRNGIYTSGNAC